ncbi:hypothetical protein ABE19_14670 [Bacillus toyonensis]|nr:hypothetical protein AT265_14410 [Bacillus cereus]MBG9610580.1 hypothetical protein [Bacillus toyonensis]MBG9843350.1 hypothetical protein [Bacillus toyonensis]MBG9852748.1 hypothetical protein [Bacillus toyonensis]MBG9873576.1 hypothetical protein [Bacillus toyonensis]
MKNFHINTICLSYQKVKAFIKMLLFHSEKSKSTQITMLLDWKGRFLCLEGLHTITYACPLKM